MGIPWYLMIIVCLWTIIPPLIVLTVLFLRMEAMRGDINSAVQRVALVFTEYQQITQQYKTIQDAIADATTRTHGVELRAVQIEESFAALSNKWSSRERAEKQAERRRKREEGEDDVPPPALPAAYPEIPGTEQQSLLSQLQPGLPQNNNHPPVRQRRFGEQW